jgi:hypothetical protein
VYIKQVAKEKFVVLHEKFLDGVPIVNDIDSTNLSPIKVIIVEDQCEMVLGLATKTDGGRQTCSLKICGTNCACLWDKTTSTSPSSKGGAVHARVLFCSSQRQLTVLESPNEISKSQDED